MCEHFKSCCWILDCSQLFILGGAWLGFMRPSSILHSGQWLHGALSPLFFMCLEFGPACNQCRCAVCRTRCFSMHGSHVSVRAWVAVALLMVFAPQLAKGDG